MTFVVSLLSSVKRDMSEYNTILLSVVETLHHWSISTRHPRILTSCDIVDRISRRSDKNAQAAYAYRTSRCSEEQDKSTSVGKPKATSDSVKLTDYTS